MPTFEDLEPVEGNWYHNLEKGQDFMVVSVDDDEELIEIQYVEGEIEELGFDEWEDLDLELSEEPEDWSAPLEELEEDDLNYEE